MFGNHRTVSRAIPIAGRRFWQKARSDGGLWSSGPTNAVEIETLQTGFQIQDEEGDR